MRVPQPKVSRRAIREAADRAAAYIYDGGFRGTAFTRFTTEVFFDGGSPETYDEWRAVERVEKSYHDVIALEVSQAIVRLATQKVTARAARLAAKREANRRYRIKRGLPVTGVTV